MLQSFDFGAEAPRRAFGRFDAGLGDGGQAVVVLPDGAAAVALTEDGGGGMQWFQSPDCRGGRDAAAAPGWLIAAPPLLDLWRERVVRLRIAPRPDACPAAFDASLTRWRLARIAMPWREARTGGRGGAAEVDTLLSEHFGGAARAAADHLERFWFARDLGLVRWERWEDPARTRLPDLARRAAVLAGSGRCPEVAFSEPPAPGWAMADCRTWTNFDRAGPPGSPPLAALPWPAPALR